MRASPTVIHSLPRHLCTEPREFVCVPSVPCGSSYALPRAACGSSYAHPPIRAYLSQREPQGAWESHAPRTSIA